LPSHAEADCLEQELCAVCFHKRGSAAPDALEDEISLDRNNPLWVPE